ncbi:hypothetical protein [Nonomuraea africana]|uniref:hypothetical protein n=1 Tax=Nonomuraea africana TaxID=46171 RepID=UPI0033DA71CD
MPPIATRSNCCWLSPPSDIGIEPSRLAIADLDAPLIGDFLRHLEDERGNSVRTRNARLAAVIQRVLSIPPKRFDRALVTYLTDPEIDALLAAPDPGTWTGRRDRVGVQTK